MERETDQEKRGTPDSDREREAAVVAENRKIRRLRFLVDFTMSLIAQSEISLDEAQLLAAGVKKQALKMFPEKGDTYDLIYAPRFRRLLTEKYGLH